MYQLICNLSV